MTGPERIRRQEQLIKNLQVSIADCRVGGRLEKAAALKGLLRREEIYLHRLQLAYGKEKRKGKKK